MSGRVLIIPGAAFLLAACAGGARDLADSERASADRIRGGMERLGASEARRDCFAGKLARSLDEEREAEAAALVEQSASRDEMRDGVLSASAPVQQAFIAASLGCSLEK